MSRRRSGARLAAPTLVLSIDHNVDAVTATVTPPSGAVNLWLSRVGPSGELTYVRGANPFALPSAGPGGGVQRLRDYEPPIGVPLTYSAIVTDAAGVQSSPTTAVLTIPAGDTDNPWLVDIASPANTQRVIVEQLAELEFEAASGVHYVLNRRTPIVTSDVARAPKFQLTFATLDDGGYEKAHGALGNGVPVLLRTPPAQGVGSMYLAATGWKEQRPSRLAQEDSRRFVVDCVQVDRPDPILYVAAAIATYAGVRDAYDSYAALDVARDSYDELLHDPLGAQAADLVPWPPTDV